jgi:hypothetical protein
MSNTDNQTPSAEQLALQATVDKLNAEILEMKKKAEEDKTADATRDAVKTLDTKPTPAPSVGVQNMRRQQAIAACGGNALWTSLPMETRLKSLGLQLASESDIELSKKLFGRNSSSIEASRLSRQNPSRYSFLRAVHRETI